MAKTILHLHLAKNSTVRTATVQFLDESFTIRSVGAGGDWEQAARLIAQAEADGAADAVALDGMPLELVLNGSHMRHIAADLLESAARTIPVVDGRGVRGAFERWSVRLLNEMEPGLFSRKHLLFAPGLNHEGLVNGVSAFTENRRWADPLFYFNLPAATGDLAMRQMSDRILDATHDKPYRRIFAQAGAPGIARQAAAFNWAQIIAGDISAIRRYGPGRMERKVVVGECASVDDEIDLRGRGVTTLITTMPSISVNGIDDSEPARWPAAVIEACMAALIGRRNLRESDYLNLLAEVHYKPAIVHLQGNKTNYFAFVIHPLSVNDIFTHPIYQFLRFVPHGLVELVASYWPPIYLSRMKGIVSQATGEEVQGYLYTLASTPRQMIRRDPHVNYKKMIWMARDAERRGARIFGLGAFTSVVGDAGVTVAQAADIAVTTGNSLTVAATLEGAKQAVRRMGVSNLSQSRTMVVGATGSIGAVCSRLLAQDMKDVTLVAPRPERLIALKRQIEQETPDARVTIATSPDDYVAEMDLIITTTSAFGQRVIDVTRCKPGAVICDVARPPDIEKWEAELRPDILVIESGEILLPGEPQLGFNIGLPPRTAYACLAETIVLAMEGRFEDYSLGRDLDMERVREIWQLAQKHGLQLAGMRSFDKYVTDEQLEERRLLAAELRADPQRLRSYLEQAHLKLKKGDAQHGRTRKAAVAAMPRWQQVGLAVAGVAAVGWLLRRLQLRVTRRNDTSGEL
jgi:predicted amino acid dehydrogenase